MPAETSTTNRRTLQAYEQAAGRYRELAPAVPGPDLAALLDELAALAPGGRVLEIGSGPGVDARELERRGLTVVRTDATAAFVALLRADGYPALQLDAITGDLAAAAPRVPGSPEPSPPFDAVFADAVFLHFTPEELAAVLGKVAAAAALLVFTVKEGDGTAWSSARLDVPRWFAYWREAPLRALLAHTGWDALAVRHRAGAVDDWLHVVARRR